MTPTAKPELVVAASSPVEGYDDLKYYFSNLHSLFSIRTTLAMDMMTATPAGGLQRRLADISSITKRIYAETTSNAVSGLLERVESHSINNPEDWSEWDLANMREMRRIHSHLAALPPDIYIASVQVANEGRKKHHAAVQSNNWDDIAPYMQQVVDLYRRITELKQKKFDTQTPYDALLLGYASDITSAEVDKLYEGMIEPLRDLHMRALDKQNHSPAPTPLDGDFSRGDQMWLNKTILELMGFDFNRGGLFVTAVSPMSGGTAEDVRILVRCGANDTFLDSLEDTLYQGGRALYLQNLPEAWRMQPAGQDLGALVVNAQSILYETILGRTPQFFDFISVRAEGVFRQFRNKSFSAENLYRLKKRINNTTHRNNADELTKIFHDILRYRIEKDLISGTLAVKDLPERWNEESRALLGHTPKGLADGALQNPDWCTGRFGFIATNTLSHIIAAELHAAMYAQDNSLPQQIRNGDFGYVGAWLKKNIHEKGRSMGAMELIRNVTGHELAAQNLLDHLERRYLSDKR